MASSWDLTPSVRVGYSPVSVSDPKQIEFGSESNSSLRQGYSANDPWFQIKINNNSDDHLEKILYFDSPQVGRLTLWQDGKYRPQYSGPGYSLAERAYSSRLAAFHIQLGPQENGTFYIKRDVHHALNTKVFLADEAEFEHQENHARTIFYFYLGGILALVVYNFFLGIFTNEKDYLYYSFFAASFGATALVLHGVVDTYIFPNKVVVFSNYLMFFSSLTLFAGCLFVERFLNITQEFPMGFWGLRVFKVLAVVPMIGSFWVPSHRNLFFLGFWIDASIALAILFFIFCGFYMLLRHAHKLATYFLCSWAVVLCGTFVWLASFYGIIPSNTVTQYSLLFANFGEMLVLALGLAYKIRVLDEQKRRALRAAEDKERYHRLVRVLSHDVANTVSGLLYHSDMLRSHVDRGAASVHLDRIYNSTQQLIQILASVRHEEVFHVFKENAEMELVDLRAVCEEVLHHYAWQLREKQLRVQMNVPQEAMVRADRAALSNQVISNIVSNCIKFSEAKKLISLKLIDDSEFRVLEITDQGMGILPEEIETVFAAKKLISHRGASNEVGTGIGTSLVSEYMKIFGGKIEVESFHHTLHAESGTTVRLIFPNLQRLGN
ncbi:sensor histidine kinase [Bdellovibrio sp. SKB1291214]|uniref:sensor histidine kinase n=1 Tax=Bdellovibrio sp. SKB1291214 TaxID=1732569 RepID=UPI000B51BEC3|nr:sensor histidine kinase [Bdellovibrio sp. SKB1291214]UYL09251.1 sensor histidine kinase [Bdellovibrio sp. SKB1291214]